MVWEPQLLPSPQEDMWLSHAISSLLGSVGVVIWGSSASMKTQHLCLGLKNYTTTEFGPFILNFTLWSQNCSKEQCSGHGQCTSSEIPRLSKLLEGTESEHEAEKLAEEVWRYYDRILRPAIAAGHWNAVEKPWSGYTCKCFNGWSGDNCSKSHVLGQP